MTAAPNILSPQPEADLLAPARAVVTTSLAMLPVWALAAILILYL